MFIKPMLAHVVKGDVLEGSWVAEEKYDGHRLVVEHAESVSAWSRYGRPRVLPPHVDAAITHLPKGVYDGELISITKPRSYGVTDLGETASLRYVVFDVLELLGRDSTQVTQAERRKLLETIFDDPRSPAEQSEGADVIDGVRLAWSEPIDSRNVAALARKVWSRDGEGLILKNAVSLYYPGKRSRDWLKIKQLRSSVLTLIGFIPGKLGRYAVVLLEDAEGHHTTVKTRNDRERARLAQDPPSFIGRKLRIEYQERTPDGSYRHPRWDRFEDE